jgi:CubicO group peptidase (beta-lactamase class C family)
LLREARLLDIVQIFRAHLLETCGFLLFMTSAGHVFGEEYPHAGEPIGTARQMYDGALTPDIAVNTFRNIDRLFPTRTVSRGKEIYPLPKAKRQLTQVRFSSRGKQWDLVDYLAVNRVAGLLVLKNGSIALERYQYGNTEKTQWMSMSVAKSITSTLIGAAVKQGYIATINEPITKYVPQLVGSAYEGVSIRDILMMSSGVKWTETYTDPASDRRRLLDVQIAQRPGAAIALMSTLSRAAPPGTVNNYSTGETQIAGEVLRNAIGRPLAQYLSERIWAKFGMEADAKWWLASPGGSEIAGSGLSARLRDYGRFGLFFSNGGVAHGEQILPAGWTSEASSPKVLKGGKSLEYGYFWWPAWATDATPDRHGAFAAIGIFGQYVYINPKQQVVIVAWGARSKPEGMDIIDDMDFFAAVVVALTGNDLHKLAN